MDKFFYSMILGPLCAILIQSCSRNPQTAEVAILPSSVLSDDTMAILSVPPPEPAIVPVIVPHRIDKILASYAPEKQHFEIASDEEGLLLCEQGSVVKFGPDIFVYSDDKQPVKGIISLEVSEFLTLQDFIFAGLATVSKDDLIESGGMLYIEASAGGRSVEIADGEYYTMEIPSPDNKEGMELFYAEEGSNGTKWVPVNDKGRFLYEDVGGMFGTFWCNPQERTEFPGGVSKLYAYLHDEVKFPEGFENTKLQATSYINFTLDNTGKISNVHTPKQISTYADNQVIAAFKKMPEWEVQNMRKTKKKMMVPVKLDLVRDPSQVPVKWVVESIEPAKRFNAVFMTDRYLLPVTRTGWLNCDRELPFAQDRTNLFVKIDSMSDATVRIVFQDINSVMIGFRYTGGFSFDRVPLGEKITIIAVRQKNGNLEMALKDTVITGGTIDDLVFYPTDPDAMKKTFSEIGQQQEKTLAVR